MLLAATLLLLGVILALAARARLFGPVAVVLTVSLSFLAVLAETGDRLAALLVAGLAVGAMVLLRSAAETAHDVAVARRERERRRRQRSSRQAWDSIAELERAEHTRRAA
jgi:hypothetical protein